VAGVPGAYYLAGLALLITLDAGPTTNIVRVLAFNVVMFALLELPLLGSLNAPERTRALVGKLDDWMRSQRRTIFTVAAGTIGLYPPRRRTHRPELT
jgi:Sap, sulfolipid-1-addressing protein